MSKKLLGILVMVVMIVGVDVMMMYMGNGIGEMVMWSCMVFVIWIMWNGSLGDKEE